MRRRLVDENVGDEPYMPTNTITIPITVSIVVISTYIGIGAVVFSVWEDWTIMSAAYFSTITLTTIGFGDLVPTRSFAGAGAGASEEDIIKMVFCIMYCGIGLALISMCIALIQEQVARSASAALGITEESAELDKVQIVPRCTHFFDSRNQDDGLAEVDGAIPGQTDSSVVASYDNGSYVDEVKDDEKNDDIKGHENKEHSIVG